jgi:hypothetical protein
MFIEQQKQWKQRNSLNLGHKTTKILSFQSDTDSDHYFHEDLLIDTEKRRARKSTLTGHTSINVTNNEFDESISIFCGTWNVGGAHPPKNYESFVDFVPQNYDIYALSFQEAGYSGGTIEKYISTYLGTKYFAICKLSLWDIKLVVLCREKHVSKITCINESSKATGFLNVCGNKGGLGVSFKFNETSLCFIGCHLAAGEDKLPTRNANVHEIAEHLRLGIKDLDITQFHHTFWMGDLNYRIDMPFEVTIDLSENNMLTELLEYDQLRTQISKGVVFSKFREAELSFCPTYKFELGNREYTRKKYRPPSWCDRILIHSLDDCDIEQLDYNSANTIFTSDHSPVFSTFKLNTRLNFLSLFSLPEMNREIVFSKVFMVGRNGSKIHKPRLSFYGTWMKQSPMHCDNIDKISIVPSALSSDSLITPMTPRGGRAVSSPTNASLRENGLSDEGNAKEQKVSALVNPYFQDSAMPKIIPTVSHLEFLKTQHIHLLVSDRSIDTGDKGLCVGSLSLKPICQNVNESGFSDWEQFCICLTYKTAHVGKLYGQYRMQPKYD